MVVNILRSISASIGKIGQENGQFKQVAAQQNNSISKFVKDISRMFASQSRQQSDMSNSLNNLEQGSVITGQKMDQTNSLLQESISIQTQMYNEMRNVSSSLFKLLDAVNANQNGNGSGSSVGSALAGVVGGAALGAGIFGAASYMESNAGTLTNLFGSQKLGYKNTGGGNNLSVAEMVKLAKEAGFSDQQAAIMGAIGAAESSGNPFAHNPNVGTGDNSYGLWQINMLGRMGAERRNQFGIQSDDQLFDPKMNATAAKKIFDEQGFEAWSVYKSGAYMPYLGTATQTLSEKDSPPGMAASASDVLGNYAKSSAGVYENQQSLAGIRKLPLSERLRGVLNQAASAAGVEVVVYSGGQSPKGSGGPRTGSTRHDNGNAADVYLTRGGRKLSDTNPEDRAIMAKFVSAAVSAGATGVGAGHNYMGPSNIHVGFGKQAVWGGAPWIRAAASGVYSNQDLASEGGGYGGGGGVTGIESVDNMLSGLTQSLAGTPFAGIGTSLTSAIATMSGGAGIIPGMLAMGPAGALVGGAMGLTPMIGNMLQTTGTTNLFENIFRPPGSEMAPGTGPHSPNKADREEVERYQYNNEENPEGDEVSFLLKNLSKEPQAINTIQNAALESEINKMNIARTTFEPSKNDASQPAPNLSQNIQSPPVYSATTSWYLQLAGRINNDETMKFKGGVFA